MRCREDCVGRCPGCENEGIRIKIDADEFKNVSTPGLRGEPSYPTADAYEAVCRARDKWQAKAEAAEHNLAATEANLDEIERLRALVLRAARDLIHAGELLRLHGYTASGNVAIDSAIDSAIDYRTAAGEGQGNG